MINAYSNIYLNDSKKLLANAFDYAINDLCIESDYFANLFSNSYLAKLIESGNPSIISGLSGIELVNKLLESIDLKMTNKRNIIIEKSKEYWAGYVLASYQWYSAKTFKDIFNVVKLSDIINMYPLLHEIDITRFYEHMDNLFINYKADTKLKNIRESRNLSQNELANISGVNIRNIQLYEQKVNDIDKAQVKTLYRLSIALNCHIEELLENPLKK